VTAEAVKRQQPAVLLGSLEAEQARSAANRPAPSKAKERKAS
jgi:hypothetical protein